VVPFDSNFEEMKTQFSSEIDGFQVESKSLGANSCEDLFSAVGAEHFESALRVIDQIHANHAQGLSKTPTDPSAGGLGYQFALSWSHTGSDRQIFAIIEDFPQFSVLSKRDASVGIHEKASLPLSLEHSSSDGYAFA
jgi:hypothetical protein